MKVTRHGSRYDNGKPYKGKCDFCGCQVEVTKKEIKSVNDTRDGNYCYVLCPECGHHIYFIDKRLGNTRPYTTYDNDAR